MDQEALLRDQLTHAHSMNALVDNHRFTLVQLLLGFHGLILGAIVFRPDAMPIPERGQWFATAVGAGIGVVGLGLASAFFSQHTYMRSYKAWIKVLEAKLHGIQDAPAAGHRGTLYWDRNAPVVGLERTLVLILGIFLLLNAGVPVLVSSLLGAPNGQVILMGSVLFAGHGIVLSILLRSARRATHGGGGAEIRAH